jgi:ankyrin repeat protein
MLWQVCTSKSVLEVVHSLLIRGADANKRNNAGESPLHCECLRLRSASFDVVEALIRAHANVNDVVSPVSGHTVTIAHAVDPKMTRPASHCPTAPATPLTIVLERGAAIIESSQSISALNNGTSNYSSPLGRESNNQYINVTPPDSDDKPRRSGNHVWVRVAELLLRSGNCQQC